MKTLTRYLSLYAALWKNSVTREMSFKGNFILWIVVELLWFGLQICFVSVLYSQTESIGSWTKWQYVLLIGASNFIQQLYHGAGNIYRGVGRQGFSRQCLRRGHLYYIY